MVHRGQVRPGETGETGGDQHYANDTTCSRETLSMLIPQFVAGEYGLFGGHESEDIWTIFGSASIFMIRSIGPESTSGKT